VREDLIDPSAEHHVPGQEQLDAGGLRSVFIGREFGHCREGCLEPAEGGRAAERQEIAARER